MTFGDLLIYVSFYFGLVTGIYFFLTLYDNRKNIKGEERDYFPSVTVAVPAYNEEKTLEKTIQSLLNLDYPKDKIEIIIVDDGSEDKTYEIAKIFSQKYSFVKVIHQKNAGKGKALNKAIALSKGEFFGCLDADSFVDPSALKKIISCFYDEQVMAVTPSMKVSNAKNIIEIIQEMEYIMGIYLRKIFSFIGGIHVTPGPFSFFRKSFFIEYGGYDEHNPTEDIEIALRIQDHGFIIENAIEAYVYTVAPKKFKPLLKQRLRWYHGFFINIEKYKNLFHPSHGNLGLILLPTALISIILAIVLLLYTSYIFIQNVYNTLKTISYVGWDYFKISFDIDIFKFGNEMFFLGIIGLLTSILIFYIANKISGRSKHLPIKFVIFSLFYWFFYGFWWLIALVYRIFGGKIKWGGRSL